VATYCERAVRVVKSTRRRLATEPSGSALGGAGSSLSRPWATCAAAGGREGGLGGAEGPILTFCCLVSACFWLEIFFLHVVLAIALRRQATGACILRRHAPGGTRARDRVQADEYRLLLLACCCRLFRLETGLGREMENLVRHGRHSSNATCHRSSIIATFSAELLPGVELPTLSRRETGGRGLCVSFLFPTLDSDGDIDPSMSSAEMLC
jgi:hypothetical protein